MVIPSWAFLPPSPTEMGGVDETYVHPPAPDVINPDPKGTSFVEEEVELPPNSSKQATSEELKRWDDEENSQALQSALLADSRSFIAKHRNYIADIYLSQNFMDMLYDEKPHLIRNLKSKIQSNFLKLADHQKDIPEYRELLDGFIEVIDGKAASMLEQASQNSQPPPGHEAITTTLMEEDDPAMHAMVPTSEPAREPMDDCKQLGFDLSAMKGKVHIGIDSKIRTTHYLAVCAVNNRTRKCFHQNMSICEMDHSGRHLRGWAKWHKGAHQAPVWSKIDKGVKIEFHNGDEYHKFYNTPSPRPGERQGLVTLHPTVEVHITCADSNPLMKVQRKDANHIVYHIDAEEVCTDEIRNPRREEGSEPPPENSPSGKNVADGGEGHIIPMRTKMGIPDPHSIKNQYHHHKIDHDEL